MCTALVYKRAYLSQESPLIIKMLDVGMRSAPRGWPGRYARDQTLSPGKTVDHHPGGWHSHGGQHATLH